MMLTKMRLASALRSTAAIGRHTRSGAVFSTDATMESSDVQSPSRVYSALVAQGSLTHDRAQAHVLSKHLDKLHRQLDGYSLPVLSDNHTSSSIASDTNATADTNEETGTKEEEQQSSTKTEPEPPVRVLVPRGLYLHGSVGTGKSMLMDLFFANVPTQQKRRVHFNKFMLEVHERIQRHKQAQLAAFGRQRNINLDPSRDVITIVAEQIASESHVLCFDEFQVTDIADALIMRKLFGVFFSRGVVMVATSNTPPQVRC